jgi:TolA-binding protein
MKEVRTPRERVSDLMPDDLRSRINLVFELTKTLNALQNLPESKLKESTATTLKRYLDDPTPELTESRTTMELSEAKAQLTQLNAELVDMRQQGERQLQELVNQQSRERRTSTGFKFRWLVVAFLIGWFLSMVSRG